MSSTYKVLSDRLSHLRGEVVTEAELVGADIEALIESGHLAKQPDAPPEAPVAAAAAQPASSEAPTEQKGS